MTTSLLLKVYELAGGTVISIQWNSNMVCPRFGPDCLHSFFIIIIVVVLGYIVTLTKVFTIYHSRIAPSIILHYLSLPFYSLNKLQVLHCC
jgi:hypothetical protein